MTHRRSQTDDTVAALHRPASYPGAVARVEAIETHMSWVFLTEEHAYKLKKPIRTAHLDHSTVAKRRVACQTELALNRRLAETVYLAVVPVVRTSDGVRVDGTGTPVDWLVKMRRLPGECMLDAKIAGDDVAPGAVDALAATLSDFYRHAEPAGCDGAAHYDRYATDIRAKRASLTKPYYGLEARDIDAATGAQQAWLASHRSVLEARGSRVVDAHGDLRPEHICLTREPVIIDCLEFDRSLRLLDPVSELSFLALECERLGARWIGDALLDGYAGRTGDEPADALVPFYKSYHALVRAAVAVWHIDDQVIDNEAHWRAKAAAYLQRADSLLRSPTNR